QHLSFGRRARLAAADCAQLLLYLAREKPQVGGFGRAGRRIRPARKRNSGNTGNFRKRPRTLGARSRAAFTALPRDSGIARARRLLLQGNCRHHFAAHGHHHVGAGPRAPAIARFAHGTRQKGGSPWVVTSAKHGCTPTSMENWMALEQPSSTSICG